MHHSFKLWKQSLVNVLKKMQKSCKSILDFIKKIPCYKTLKIGEKKCILFLILKQFCLYYNSYF